MRWSSLAVLAALAAWSCGLQDATTPVPQPDSDVFGRVVSLQPTTEDSSVTEVEIKAGLPDKMQTIMDKEGRLAPQLDTEVRVVARVTSDTICYAGRKPTSLADFRVGQEVGIVPAPGTTAMYGTRKIVLDAAEFHLFTAYQMRYLARSLDAVPESAQKPNDPRSINSVGNEVCPIPAQDGRVLYFAAGLLPAPLGAGKSAVVGAERAGVRSADGQFAPWAVGGFRPYRTEWVGGSWQVPAPVEFSGLAANASARLTWISKDETSCLVEVLSVDGPRKLCTSTRKSAKVSWGALEPLKLESGEATGDGQRFGKNDSALVWTSFNADSSDLWLAMDGKPGQMLEPKINTLGPEWAPRVGPATTLYFCRGDRQLLLSGGIVQEIRLPGPQRVPFIDGVFLAGRNTLLGRVPRLAVGQLEWDLVAVPKVGTDKWGEPVSLDEWKPVD